MSLHYRVAGIPSFCRCSLTQLHEYLSSECGRIAEPLSHTRRKGMSLQSLGAAYGSSSDSGSDDDEAGTSAAIKKTSSDDNASSSAAMPTIIQPDAAGQRDFFKNASDCSSDDDEEHQYGGVRRTIQTGTEKSLPRLPSAFEVLNKSTMSSVFQTKQAAEEAASTAALEHHVKLTAAVVKETNKERAPVCRAFKKGRCNKGDRCRFSHVVAGGLRANEAAKNANPDKPDPADVKFVSAPVAYDGWEREEKAKKRRKPGVTNTLLPAKKAMQMFQEQKAKDQPWTTQSK